MMNHFTPQTLFSIVILLLIPHSSSADDTQSLILDICSHTDDSLLCTSVFNRLRSPTTDITGLTEIAIFQTLKNASNTRTLMREALGTEKSKGVQRGYKICLDLYEKFVDQFKDVDLDFQGGDYTTMTIHIGPCFMFVDDCFWALRRLSRRAAHLGVQNAHNRVLLQMSLFCGYYIIK